MKFGNVKLFGVIGEMKINRKKEECEVINKTENKHECSASIVKPE